MTSSWTMCNKLRNFSAGLSTIS